MSVVEPILFHLKIEFAHEVWLNNFGTPFINYFYNLNHISYFKSHV